MQYFIDNKEIDYSVWDQKMIECIELQCFFKKNYSIGISNRNIVARRDSLIKVCDYQLNSFCYDDHSLLFRLGIESPMIAITYPITVGYRKHQNSASKDISFIANGILSMIASEKDDAYPGGKKIKMDRRGLICTNLLSIIYRHILFNKRESLLMRLILIIKIVFNAREILLFGMIRKIRSRFYYSKIHSIDA